MKWMLALLLIVLCYTQAISAWDRNQERVNFMDLQEKEFMDSEDEKIIDLQEEIDRLNEDISCLKGDVENLKKEKEVLKERSSKVSTLCRPRPIPIPRPRPTRPTRPPVAVCEQPKVVGRCKALIPRWYFNIQTGQCEQFNYGGCGGNENNFETKNECNKKCGKKGCPRFDPWPEPESRQCNAVDRCNNEKCSSKGKLCCPTRCGYSCVRPENENDEPEDEFISEDVEDDYEDEDEEEEDDDDKGGEEWTPDNDEDHDDYKDMSDDEDDMEDDWESVDETGDDEEHDVCSQPKKIGPCKKALQRWFYHSKSGICKKFTYGGCKGNGNNFETRQECKNACCTDEEELRDSEEEEQEEGDEYKDQEENMEEGNEEVLVCPPPPEGTFGTCTEECSQKAKDCPGEKLCCPKGLMCCSNGCGHKCMQGVPSSSLPCKGAKPLKDKDTGKDWYCGRGGKQCPDSYYCDVEKGDRWAKCCKKRGPKRG